MSNDSTVLFTDIHKALSSDKENQVKPACLLVVGGDLNGTIFDLKLGETSFGRSVENSYQVELRGVSRRHFAVHINEEQAILEDLGSSNGTFLNNAKLDIPTTLFKGDIIKIGNIAFKYLPKGDPERITFEKLQRDAHTDGLTGCFNKMYFNNALELELTKSKLNQNPLSLIIFDLDHFKHLNDNYGHDAGDFVLKEMAKIIKNNGVRENDIFARYGGEEFVILLPKTTLAKSVEIAERVRKLIEEYQFMYDAKRLPVTASIGVAEYSTSMATGTDLFKRADQAVYLAKNNGRNQVKYYKE